MQATTIVFLLAILVALGLSGYNTWAVMQVKKAVVSVNNKADVSINVAQNSKLQVGNVLDLDEFTNLDPELKSMYKQVYVGKMWPAVVGMINDVWAAVPADKQEEVRIQMQREGDKAVAQLARHKEQAIRMMSKELGRGRIPARKIQKAVVLATMKPIMRSM